MAHTLVVGGTGMLSDVTMWLAEQGNTVSVISRRADQFVHGVHNDAHRLNPVTVDYRKPNNLRESLSEAITDHGPIELAVLNIHSDAPNAFRAITEQITSHGEAMCRVFHVRGSGAYLRPDGPDVPANCLYRQVILGFVLEQNASRWLTHEEISAGVIRAIQDDTVRTVVGTLEPWSRRPL